MSKCKVEIFSRVTGFFSPIQVWNPGKVEEFKQRKKFDKSIRTMTTRRCNNSKEINTQEKTTKPTKDTLANG